MMEQPDFFNIPSPCRGVCEADNKGFCKGCLRSREERLYWLEMTDMQKHQVMHLLALRRARQQKAAWEQRQGAAEPPNQMGLDF